ncbi:VCBS repeat-containing protein [Acidobacteria bacterium AH-259-O06]|nr:VCBS repeat-containing protein [Acidobacteria bacterium AH-259-O06]
MTCLPTIFVLLMAGFCLAQEADYRVQPKFSRPMKIAGVLERVDADNDRWIGERDYEAIGAKLKQIAGRLKKGTGGFESLADVLQRFERLVLVEFKIVGSYRARPDEPVARLRVRVELGGETPDKKLLSLLGHMEMTWVRSDQDWKLQNTQVEPLREVVAAQPYFTDVTDQAVGHNPSFRYQLAKGIDHWRSVLDEAVGITVYGHNGLAVGDYDGDGWEDLYICQPSGLPNRLYRNNGDGTFADATGNSGLDILDDTSMALFADLENDGDQDLIVIAPDRPLLFRNDGEGHFMFEADSVLAPPAGRASMLTGAALADYDNDGDLDLYVCSYEFWQPGAGYATPTPYYDATNGPPNYLFRNRGDWTFEEVTEKAGLMENNDRFSFAAAWGDYDDDGDQDLYVANDFGRNNLYRNDGDGTFTDVAAEAGVEDMAADMSAAWGDYDNDGDLDLYVSNMWSSAGQRVTHNPQFRGLAASDRVLRSFQRHARGNSLFRNNGDGTFRDVTLQAGVEMGRWAWSSDFVDLNNDGWQDIYITNGYVTGPDPHDL